MELLTPQMQLDIAAESSYDKGAVSSHPIVFCAPTINKEVKIDISIQIFLEPELSH
jgi:hypothetical protein